MKTRGTIAPLSGFSDQGSSSSSIRLSTTTSVFDQGSTPPPPSSTKDSSSSSTKDSAPHRHSSSDQAPVQGSSTVITDKPQRLATRRGDRLQRPGELGL
ncbi:unnamed protein product [Ilex paraguariensis]|uniref:Uncharacterized protein n=1 Tax=Ilex paraguariensis TaxID=185542 RepID=A0ABC8RYK8_9AQUA